jgi:predicted acylesterase/phospholipase RssA
MALEQEVRFALVLYGGASLAIYIHGVTLEFFHLVRATAVDADGKLIVADTELAPTERVYRTLGGIVRARFLVDIASGTSAGGINAVFLGKALANGQTLDQLSELWLDQADAKDLLNDAKRPRSLLSSRMMYTKLSNAFEGMDCSACGARLQPEMDVFVTATDIQGLELPIQLADKTVFEKRHKSVFHLHFGDGENHFAKVRNSFLSFVAQATSAFPFAFEPACAGDTGRTFIDGGFLDNKPFSHAVEALSKRISELPTVRKLVYIEPSPDLPSGNDTGWLAALRLRGDQTIREDLQRVLERNRLIERVKEISSHLDADIEGWSNSRVRGEEYARRTLVDEIHDRGPGYAGYHRLKVRAVTDELAAMMGAVPAGVHVWRQAKYSEQDRDKSESRFLLEYDLGYRQRRLRFLLLKLTDPVTRRELTRIATTLKTPCRMSTPAAIADYLRPIFTRAAADTEACLDSIARRYFDRFEYYDQISFPVFYEAGVGEAELCEVYRISPCDATSIVDENAPGEKRRKLAGTALFHFGAFLSRAWRVNDLAWGRLDGAERIIRSVLPPDSIHAGRLIRQAHLAIGGSPPVLQRKLPLLTRISLGFRTSLVLLRMLLSAGYFTRNGQRRTK